MNTLSPFLQAQKPAMKALAVKLRENFDYASVLGTDVAGKSFSVSDRSSAAADTHWNERGFVVRVYKDGRYYEYSFNDLQGIAIKTLADRIKAGAEAAAQRSGGFIRYPLINEEPLTRSYAGNVSILPDAMTSGEKIAKLKDLNTKIHQYSNSLVNAVAAVSTVAVSKAFVSDKKDLEQNYVWSEGMIMAAVIREQTVKTAFKSFSGLKGMEILDEMEEYAEDVVRRAEALLDAGPMPPGFYDVVCGPEAVGIIAHEAFGHGVEMDMFVKNRAKSVEYLGKPIASDIVTMHDGAASAKQVSSYLFDDEGTLGTDTVIIKDGIMLTGISDLLSALKLGTVPTGNGKRESFERKAYTRMTNTFFQPGNHKLDDMIASVSHGYFIRNASSGMEDPKDWGIQVMFESAEEIVDGKLTGKIVAPVIMTGYVPDVLNDISMISDDFELAGAGGCGKGYKEWVKVSCGGPYIKTKARLG